MTTFKEAQIIIGIDPDLEKSGVAILGNDLQLKNMTFPETVELFRNEQDSIKKVVIEAGWENKKANFRVGGCHSRQVNEQIARRVGMNHATGILLAEIAQALGLAVLLVKPTKSKLNAEQFNKITGWQGRTNQEQRDAGMLIWGMR
ncbi:TPA: hypothetical protein PPD39_003606 [Acinetobacter baumannii]|jgi:hypothetical protein|uniref:hypothetical protein n=1 Tax=Acinetobacter baumannii TaxID=470 RepID=UPI000AFBCCBB|nr:hypothetical protein [Acinetobacter baumannii]EHU1299954.1 hypothetical protein [Acinetobacter baumannii]KAB1096479.1 hypothetical protein F6W73_18480 [Acinetobacter baumannii]MCV4243165.1 hypothetical protein [Acinetobacter baumannii]MDA4970928.1 hypothetical protein [Acinetobacter baumannii]MDP7910751.1 hypothetical protein [Acinetobacter baumannii]